MKWVVTALFWAVVLVTVPICFVFFFLLFLATAPFDADRRVLHAVVCRWTHQYIRLSPTWDVKVVGREHLPRGPAVLVANHQSMADIVAAMGLDHPFKFVSKASLFSLPVVGWMMSLLRYIRVERGRPRSMQAMLADCRRWLGRGQAVLLFPEGTYSPDGLLLPFKRGAFKLAIEARVPLVPVVIEGTRGLVIDDGPWMSPRCRIRVNVLPAIAPSELGTNEVELAARVRGLIARHLGQ